MTDNLTIAVSKGRIFTESLPLLEKAGIIPKDDPFTSRKLILETNDARINLIIIRAADVPTFVEHGAADLGIAGKDVLLEHEGNELYEPLDLGIAQCRLMLAEPVKKTVINRRLRIATKYIKTSRDYFTNLGIQVEIIKLYGSMELAPIMGLSDKIVDLVDTGNTLKANGLVPVETICEISSRLIVNKAAMKMKREAVKKLIQTLTDVIQINA
ncbi:MAG: ATP phosphoribosyltransferase [Gammaproteobacteria bacterium]